ncbi:MAG TPA: aminoacetone oxidase family FAD-binding enzyme [Ruminococcus sp.]|nr:aminoacetone oxidase family FAD-binding enzyme [Ruminococcus sp.]
MYTDIAVIGGGASGYAAAIAAKEKAPSASVTIYERLDKTGRKIIASGNGKCNLSNVDITAANYHGSFDVMEILGKTPDCKSFFTDKLGVMLSVGSEGRTGGVYPRSNSSATVLNALRIKAAELGIEEVCGCMVTGLSPVKNGFQLETSTGRVTASRVIAAAGGYAGPSFGTDGSFLRILKDMGLRTAKICPAVGPLKVGADRLKGLKGVRIKGSISAVSEGRTLRTEQGEIQFNENTISGICVFNLAYLFQEYEGKLELSADLLPDLSEAEIADILFAARRNRKELPAYEILTGIFVKNLAVYLIKNVLGRSPDEKAENIGGKEIKQLASAIKGLVFPITGCAAWQNAQVTCGGIHRSCVDDKLCSTAYRGLYLCGEILDVAGDCGGYNLQWAWSSGIWAGMNCAESLKGGRK